MASDTKMLQILIDGQVSIRKEMRDGQTSIKNQVSDLEKKVDKGFKEVNKRLGVIGADVAHLQDDTPTIKEFDALKKKVDKYHPTN